MQRVLTDNKYYDGPINGFMDNDTFGAILKYKKDKLGSITPTVFDTDTLKLFNIQ